MLAITPTLAFAAPVPKVAKKVDPYPTTVGTEWEYIPDGDAKAVCVEEITKVTVTHTDWFADGVG